MIKISHFIRFPDTPTSLCFMCSYQMTLRAHLSFCTRLNKDGEVFANIPEALLKNIYIDDVAMCR